MGPEERMKPGEQGQRFEQVTAIWPFLLAGCLGTVFMAVLFPPQRNVAGLSDLLPHEPLWVMVLVFFLLAVVFQKRLEVPRYGLPGGAWINWMLLATLLAIPSLRDSLYVFKVIFLFSLVPVVSLAIYNRSALSSSLNFLVALAVGSAWVAIFQQLGNSGVAFFEPFSHFIYTNYTTPGGFIWSRVAGTFDGNPNSLGAFLAMTTVLTLAVGSQKNNPWYFLAATIQVVALLLTRSNGALFSLFCGVVSVLAIARQKRVGYWTAGLVLVGLLTIVADTSFFGAGFWDRLLRPGSLFAPGSSVYTRLVTWRVALSIYPLTGLRMWVGYGPLTEVMGYTSTGEPLRTLTSFDNSYLNMLIKFGVMGTLLFFLLMASLLRHAYWAWRSGLPVISPVGLGSLGAMIGMLMQSFTGDFLPYGPRVALVFWFLAGLAVAAERLAQQGEAAG